MKINIISEKDVHKVYGQSRYINKEFFKSWSYNMSYILGYISADGTIFNGNNYYPASAFFTIYSKDKDILLDIKDAMASSHPIWCDNRHICYRLQIKSVEMVQDLLNLGITPNKSFTLEFPDIPEEFMNNFIRGVFDGDGCVCIRSDCNSILVSIANASDNFTLILNSVLHNVGINSHFLRRSGELFGIQITKKSEVKKFYDFIYKHDGICLKRKKDIFDKFFGCDINETI